MTSCNDQVNNRYYEALKSEYNRLGLYNEPADASSGSTYGDMMFEWSKSKMFSVNNTNKYPTKEVSIYNPDGSISTTTKSVPVIPQQQNAAIIRQASLLSSSSCYTPCKPNRMGAGRYYGSASNCKNDGTQGSCYMYSYPNPQTSTNPNAPVGPNTRRFARNFIPTKANAYGLKLLFNNNKFSLTSSATGRVGTTAGASRAINRGRASARNAAKLSYNRK